MQHELAAFSASGGGIESSQESDFTSLETRDRLIAVAPSTDNVNRILQRMYLRCAKRVSVALHGEVEFELEPVDLLHDTEPAGPPIQVYTGEGALEFVKERQLEDDFRWLSRVAPFFFPDSRLEVEVISGHEDEDDNLLDVRVYNPHSLSEFRAQMHSFYDRMLEEGRNDLYEVVSITHWRRKDLGLQAFPGYRALPS
jgi:hypothetical protein